MNYIDFHAHLDCPEFGQERERIITESFASGIKTIVTVVDPYSQDSLRISAEIIGTHPQVRAIIGAHPHEAARYSPEVEQRIFSFSKDHGVCGIGEAGLDFHYNFSPPDAQRTVFQRQLAIAREMNLPLIVHSRKAENEILDLLHKSRFPQPVVFHCFTGDRAEAAEILHCGYSLSFSGIITFRNAGELREVVRTAPLDRIFSETDSPYLAPEPFRGKVNRPANVAIIATRIADIKEAELEDVLAQIESNLDRFLELAP